MGKKYLKIIYPKRYLYPEYILSPTIQQQKGNRVLKWASDLNRQFSKEYTRMANKHRKRYSTSLVQIKAMGCDFIFSRIAKMKKKDNNSVSKNVEKLKHSHISSENTK